MQLHQKIKTSNSVKYPKIIIVSYNQENEHTRLAALWQKPQKNILGPPIKHQTATPKKQRPASGRKLEPPKSDKTSGKRKQN